MCVCVCILSKLAPPLWSSYITINGTVDWCSRLHYTDRIGSRICQSHIGLVIVWIDVKRNAIVSAFGESEGLEMNFRISDVASHHMASGVKLHIT